VKHSFRQGQKSGERSRLSFRSSLSVYRFIATVRLIFVPALLVVTDPTDMQIAVLSNAPFAAAFVLHASVAELWIRATRRSGVP
jgi:hypothetical protein